MYFILFYDYVEGVAEKRAPYRDGHLALLAQYAEQGKLVLGGAYSDPLDGAALIFKVDDKTDVEAFTANDPYMANGLVTSWQIREWSVAVGSAL